MRNYEVKVTVMSGDDRVSMYRKVEADSIDHAAQVASDFFKRAGWTVVNAYTVNTY